MHVAEELQRAAPGMVPGHHWIVTERVGKALRIIPDFQVMRHAVPRQLQGLDPVVIADDQVLSQTRQLVEAVPEPLVIP